MKTMRRAFLAAGVLAAMIGTSSAQTVNPDGADLFLSDAQFTANGLAVTGVTPGFTGNGTGNTYGAPLQPVGVAVATAGPILIPVTPGGTSFGFWRDLNGNFSAESREFFYTTTLTGLTFAGGSVSDVTTVGGQTGVNINTVYTNGTFNMYFQDPPNTTYSGNANTDAAGTFGDGAFVLNVVDVTVQSTFFLPTDASGTPTGARGFGTVNGFGNLGLRTLPFLINGEMRDIAKFLDDNNLTFVQFSANIDARTGVRPGYDFAGTGLVDFIPEPTTIALFGSGLLPLGMFLRRRRS